MKTYGLDLRDSSFHFSFWFMLSVDPSKRGFDSEQEFMKLEFKNENRKGNCH